MKISTLMASTALAACLALAGPASADNHGMKVKITPKLGHVDVIHNGQKATISRDQNSKNTVNPAFAKTSRPCPPFCINPISMGHGVETIGEVEIIHYAKMMSDGDSSIMVIDNRTPDWVKRGTIPSAINVPFTKLAQSKGATPVDIAEAMESFGATEMDGIWDYSKAKTLVLFCNGMWCGQSPMGIRSLLKHGYPADKIKWYRGGMQNWEILGLSTAK